MRRTTLLALLAIAAIAFTTVALSPHELVATKTVGDQARAQRVRRIEPNNVEPAEPRICNDGETPTDRDPCIGAHGRLDYIF